MKNYERYRLMTPGECKKKGLMYYLCRHFADKKIFPLINKIKNKKILDVGIGAGYYSKVLMKKNQIIGLDQNPHLCNLPLKLIKGDATKIASLVSNKKMDIIFSTWMTEYLNEKELVAFFKESNKVLARNGKLITTIIAPSGFGSIYVFMAKMIKGINKYTYSEIVICKLLQTCGFNKIKIIPLNGFLMLPWAFLVIAE